MRIKDIQLTENFKLSEFFVSGKTDFEFFSADYETPLFYLCKLLLQPIREHTKLPITITSGFRTYEENKKINGKPQSLHLSGYAADFICAGYSLESIFSIIKIYLKKYICELILHDDYIHIAVINPIKKEQYIADERSQK